MIKRCALAIALALSMQAGSVAASPQSTAFTYQGRLSANGQPADGNYVHEHTKRWSATVARADAFVFVTPEYDFGPPASLINALQYLVKEWAYKPVGLLSYGGVSAGLRSANALRVMITANNMMPLPGAVSIPLVGQLVNKETGVFEPGEVQAKAANSMLAELARWERAMRVLRSA